MNRPYIYSIKDIKISDKKKYTYTLERYYLLLLKTSDGRKFRIHSAYWPKYFELKEMLDKLGAYYE